MHFAWGIVGEPIKAVFGFLLVGAGVVYLLSGGDLAKSVQMLAMVADVFGNIIGMVVYSIDDLFGGVKEVSALSSSGA